MESHIRALIIEDSDDDSELILRVLKQGGYQPSSERVENAEGMRKALAKQEWDVILCDYQMPNFTAIAALNLLQETGLDIPLIIVSGVIGERTAVECMRLGAHDFFVKGNLVRLASAVKREIQEAESRAKRREAEKSQRESEDKFKFVFDHSIIGKSITFPSGEIQANNAFAEMLGYSHEELKNYKWQDITHPDDLEISQRIVDSILSGEKSSERFIKRYIHKDGSVVWADVGATLRRDQEGQPLYLMTSISDITAQKKDQKKRLRLEKELRQAQKMESIGSLAGGIAHDFNNILTSIIGFTEMCFDEVEKGTVIEDYLQEIHLSGIRAKDLVSQILTFARKSEEEKKPLQVNNIVKEALKFIRSTLPTSIEIRQNIQSDSLINANDTQVHQIMLNLFTNAAHAMDEGGILEISLKDVLIDRSVQWERLNLKPDNYIEIKVSDTGTGIPPEIIDSIFDPYFTTKGRGEGTGMGLALVHSIIESYGGRISVDSKVNQGTTFTIYLPITKKRQEGQSYHQSEQLPTGTEHILFVDDEASIVRMSRQTLERLGYTVTTSTSSLEAMELFRRSPNDFDLVISDMTMPKMTGDRLAVEMQLIRSDVPVILCSGYSKNISKEASLAKCIKALVDKPIGKVHFAKTVRKVLDEVKNPDSSGK